MNHKGIQYQVVQTANPTGFKWTVNLDDNRIKTGVSCSHFQGGPRHRKSLERISESQVRPSHVACPDKGAKLKWKQNPLLQLLLPKSPIAKNAMGRCALLVLRGRSPVSCTMFTNAGSAEVRRASSPPSKMPPVNSRSAPSSRSAACT